MRSLLLLFCFVASGQAALLNVTNYGATGDARWLIVNTASNSTHVAVTNGTITAADVGKLFLVFNGGAYTTATNNGDLLASVVAVSGTNVTLSLPAGGTSNTLWGMVGTENAANFTAAIAACAGTNDVITVPAGTYLCASADLLNTNFVMSGEVDQDAGAIILQRGGIIFQGQGGATIMQCGAWQKKGSYGLRGFLFNLKHPVTNDYPLIFADLTFDGGVPVGQTAYHGFPIRTSDGDGWDETHDAFSETTGAQQHSYKEFRNCTFRNWRGEMLKGTTANTTGFIVITNCAFTGGNASAFNFTMAHSMDACTFSNLFLVTEFYEGYAQSNSVMKNCTTTNISGNVVVINGALTNRTNPTYTITNNLIHSNGGGVGLLLTPAQNVVATSNRFFSLGSGVQLGSAGGQGTAAISNIMVTFNQFYGVQNCVLVSGTSYSVSERNNFADGGLLAGGFGYTSNFVLFNNNCPTATIDSTALCCGSPWFFDDLSNNHAEFLTGDGAVTNTVSYSRGWRQRTWKTTGGSLGSYYLLDAASPALVPAQAEMVITHQGFDSTLILGSGSQKIVNGQSVYVRWDGTRWNPAASTFTSLTAGQIIVR